MVDGECVLFLLLLSRLLHRALDERDLPGRCDRCSPFLRSIGLLVRLLRSGGRGRGYELGVRRREGYRWHVHRRGEEAVNLQVRHYPRSWRIGQCTRETGQRHRHTPAQPCSFEMLNVKRHHKTTVANINADLRESRLYYCLRWQYW